MTASLTPGPPAAPRSGPAGGVSAGLGRQIARNSAFSLAGRSVYVLGWVLIAPFLLRHLGPERFGLWSIVSMVSGLYQTFDFGVSGALTRFVAEFRAARDARSLRHAVTLASAFVAGLILVCLLGLILLRRPLLAFFHVGPALEAEAGRALLGAGVLFGFLSAYNLQASVLGGLQRLDVWNRVSMVVTLLQLAGMWGVTRLGGGLVELLEVNAASLAVGIVVCAVAIRRLAPEIAWGPVERGGALMARVARYGAALQVINIGVLVQFQLEKVTFGRFVSLSSVGSYELGYRVVFALWALPAFLLAPLLPAFAHLDAVGDRPRFEAAA